jgi:hypothetical protein
MTNTVRIDCTAQRGIAVLACHAVILSAAKRSEPAAAGRSGLFRRGRAARSPCSGTAGRDHQHPLSVPLKLVSNHIKSFQLLSTTCEVLAARHVAQSVDHTDGLRQAP